jgi:hypothetical protein
VVGLPFLNPSPRRNEFAARSEECERQRLAPPFDTESVDRRMREFFTATVTKAKGADIGMGLRALAMI